MPVPSPLKQSSAPRLSAQWAAELDVFKLPDKSFELPVMGTLEVSDGKISAWRDYFDMNHFVILTEE